MGLRYYQTDSVQATYNHLRTKRTNPCVVIPTAGGKSWCIGQIASDVVTQWGGRCLVIAGTKELLEQNAAKVKAISPDLDVGLYSAGLDKYESDKPVVVGGIQSLYNKAEILGHRDICIIDECFPADTMISTPKGQVPISSARIGMPVHNAIGVGIVQAVSARKADKLIELELNNGTVIRCTPNHPLFADGEWRCAGVLELGSRLYGIEDVCNMRTRFQAEGVYGERSTEANGETALGTTEILFDLMCKTHVKSGMGKHEQRCAQGSEDESPLRQWLSDAGGAEKTQGVLRRTCDSGVCSEDEREAASVGISQLLQDRPGDSFKETRLGTGRGVASLERGPEVGSEEDAGACGIRVVRIAHIEPPGGVIVFNLQVSGHPSYYAGGVLVHNCHLIPPDGDGMYRTFVGDLLKINPKMRVIGFTATDWRTGAGPICTPDNILNEVCYEIGIRELMDKGFISKVVAKSGQSLPDISGLHIRAGEFVAEDVDGIVNRSDLVVEQCREIARYTKDRKACLIFCSSVAHAETVAKTITSLTGEECPVVTGETPAYERSRILARLRGDPVDVDLFGNGAKPLKYCANVSVLTTGTDIPRLDTIAMLRVTASSGLFLQIIGRGFRLSPETGKTECLLLDYGRHVERFGPIDTIKGREPRDGGRREALAKTCPQCHEMLPLNVMACPECGYVYPQPEKKERLDAEASTDSLLSGEVTTETLEVTDVTYEPWKKRGAPEGYPRTVRVTYWCGLNETYSEWLCPEHTGYARRKFEDWFVLRRAGDEVPVPRNVDEFLDADFAGAIRKTREITIRRVSGERFPDVVKSVPGDLPEKSPWLHTDGADEGDYDDLPF